MKKKQDALDVVWEVHAWLANFGNGDEYDMLNESAELDNAKDDATRLAAKLYDALGDIESHNDRNEH